MVYTPIDQRNDVKMFKLFAVTPLACGWWFHSEYTVYSTPWKIVVELLSISRNLLTYTGENNFSIK